GEGVWENVVVGVPAGFNAKGEEGETKGAVRDAVEYLRVWTQDTAAVPAVLGSGKERKVCVVAPFGGDETLVARLQERYPSLQTLPATLKGNTNITLILETLSTCSILLADSSTLSTLLTPFLLSHPPTHQPLGVIQLLQNTSPPSPSISLLTTALHLPLSTLSSSPTLILQTLRHLFNPQKYLLHLPWEQLNNQLIALKSACALASLLNRTLVLPPLGHRSPSKLENKEWDFSFEVREFEWKSFAGYFTPTLEPDGESLGGVCEVMRMETYTSLFIDSAEEGTFPAPLFNPLAKATSVQQLKEYYGSLLGMSLPMEEMSKLEEKGGGTKMVQLTEKQVLQIFNANPYVGRRHLLLGAAFWMYGFGKTQVYPLENYVSYIPPLLDSGTADERMYARITASLKPHPRLVRVVRGAWERFMVGVDEGEGGEGKRKGVVT
ncbi:hypothetical protein HDV05_001796, partial [Chytridiales sp. JEL 0842]